MRNIRTIGLYGVIAILSAGLLDFLANYLAAHILLNLDTFLIPGGTFLFAITFTLYDFIRRQYGIEATIAAISLGFLSSILYSTFFGGGVGRVAVAGLLALAASGSCDLLCQTLTLKWPIWRYVLASNAASLLIDSIVFATIAFAFLPFDVRLHIIEGQYLAKMAMTLLSIPLVYGARQWTLRAAA